MIARGVTWTLLGCLFFVVGCRDDEPAVRYHQVQGAIQKIRVDTKDAKRGRVTLRFRHLESGEWREVEGDVLADTEIMINGQVGTLQDLQVGNEAIVEGRVETVNKSRRVEALKITVTRADPIAIGGPKDPGS